VFPAAAAAQTSRYAQDRTRYYAQCYTYVCAQTCTADLHALDFGRIARSLSSDRDVEWVEDVIEITVLIDEGFTCSGQTMCGRLIVLLFC
jgi:hypothetical protein